MTYDTQRIIGSCVRFYRERLGLSQENLASRADISYQYLSGIETGRENFSIGVLQALCNALNIPMRNLISTAFDHHAGNYPPLVNSAYFRRHVPLPDLLSYFDLENALNHTQAVIHKINMNMIAESGVTLQSIIQGNNFSGLVSNILSNSFDVCTRYKHNHHQKYPDLICSAARNGFGEGLEIKTTVKIGKGGESHNGHDGWHLIACYNFLENGDIQFVHTMFAWLNNYRHEEPDWKYVGSTQNEETGSQRTETFNTTPAGTAKLRDGSAYLDPTKVLFNRWRQPADREIPPWSIWY